MNGRIVIIGGGAAGMSAATAARRVDSSCDILVVEKGEFVAYAHCGIPYYVSDLIRDYRDLLIYPPGYFEKERNIRVLTGAEVTEINPSTRQVTVWQKGDHSFQKTGYDSLILATGARPRLPVVPGVDGRNVLTVRSLEDGIRLKELLRSGRIRKSVIIGGGFLGIVLSEALTSRGIRVTIIEQEKQILRGFDSDMAAFALDRLAGEGVEVIRGASVKRFLLDQDRNACAVSTEGETVDTDLVISTIGVMPAGELFQGFVSGMPGGAIDTDDRMGTSMNGIYACGDCTTAWHRAADRKVYQPLGTTANKQGRVAGENAAGRYGAFPGIVGTQAVKVYDLELARTGLSEEEARSYGYKTVTALTTSPSRAEYMPGGSRITTKVTVEAGSGRILGAQMAGKEDVVKRLDIFVPVITGRMKLQDAVALDISYTPWCSPLWDPVLFCLRQALRVFEGNR